jgi:hypothetical protein
MGVHITCQFPKGDLQVSFDKVLGPNSEKALNGSA